MNATNATLGPDSDHTAQQTTQPANGQPPESQQASSQANQSHEETIVVEIGPNGHIGQVGQVGNIPPTGGEPHGGQAAAVSQNQAENAPSDAPSHGEGGTMQVAPSNIFFSEPHEGFSTPKPGQTTKDLRLIKRALREGWKVPEAAAEALPRGLLEIFAAPNPPVPGKAPPRGAAKYAYATEHRLQAAGHLIHMNADNLKADFAEAELGPAGGEVDAMTATRQLEQARKDGCLVIDEDFIRRQLESSEQIDSTLQECHNAKSPVDAGLS
jgi:hypothetical protein